MQVHAYDVSLQILFRRLLKMKTELGIKLAPIPKVRVGKQVILVGLFQPLPDYWREIPGTLYLILFPALLHLNSRDTLLYPVRQRMSAIITSPALPEPSEKSYSLLAGPV